MVWSNWRGALVVVAAWVALAWSQAFTQSSPDATGKAERILTLYEHGKAIKCRIVGSWKDASGQMAHQLQALDTGELITIVEMGPGTSVPGEGRRSIRTRNFHWGARNRVPPAGCPTPPSEIMMASFSEPAAKDKAPEIISSTPPVVVEKKEIPEKTQYIWWEEKDGKRVSPIVTTKGENPFTNREPIVLPPNPPITVVKGPETTACDPCVPPVIVRETPIAPPGSKRLGERIRDFFGPKPTVVAKTAPSTPLIIEPRTPFSTASDPALVKPKPEVIVKNPVVTLPETKPEMIVKNPVITLPETKPLQIGTPEVKPPLAKSGDPLPTLPDTTPKSDWRKMWGSGAVAPTQPGQSLVQAAAKPGAGPVDATTTSVKKDDILLKPERFDPPKLATPVDTAAGPKVPITELPMTAPPAGHGVPPGSATLPMGSQSVLAAKSGAYGPVTYLPVPITTVPDTLRPPMPPPPRMPEPPQPTAYLNAFTPPPAPAGSTPTHMAHPGWTHPGMSHPGMSHPGMAHSMMNPAMMPMPYGYAPAAAHQPVGLYNMPRHYSGPMPPNPYGMNPHAMPQAPVMPVNYMTPAPGPTPGPAAEIAQLLMVVRESPYPAQREWAATQLSTYDWRMQPEIVPALIQGARHDPAATVRAGCVYSLSRLNAASQPVLETLNALRADSDARVRQEVENALVRMGFKR